MTIKKSQEHLSKDEMIEILKRNVNLFRDEEEFVEYIVNLTLYLVESRTAKQQAAPSGSGAEAADGSNRYESGDASGIIKHSQRFMRTRERDAELVKILSKYRGQVKRCRVCGAETKDHRVCPSCGNLSG